MDIDENNRKLFYKTPNKSDLESFQKWKNKRRKKLLQSIIFILILLIIIGIIGFPAMINANFENKLFGIIVYLIFIVLDIYLLKEYFKMRLWVFEKCNYGIIIDKYRSYRHTGGTKPNKNPASEKNTTGHIIILVDGIKLNINTCNTDEYNKLKINDEIIAFLSDDNHIYIIKK